jgi:hypothetical protein
MNKEMKQKLADLRRLDPVAETTIHQAESTAGPLMQAILAGDVRAADPPAFPGRRSTDRGGSRRAAAGARRLVPAAIVAALLATAIVTAPGQAVAGWIGARLGIGHGVAPYGGHVGGPPKDVQTLRDASRGASPANGQPFVLLAQGALPQNTHWQLDAYRPRPNSAQAGHPVCFVVSLPEPGWWGGPGCVTPGGSSLEVDPLHGRVWAGSVPGRAFSFADGVTSGAAAKVVATSGGKRASVQLVPIPAHLLRRFGIQEPLKFFIARFWGNDSGPVAVKAFDGSGGLISQARSAQAVRESS